MDRATCFVNCHATVLRRIWQWLACAGLRGAAGDNHPIHNDISPLPAELSDCSDLVRPSFIFEWKMNFSAGRIWASARTTRPRNGFRELAGPTTAESAAPSESSMVRTEATSSFAESLILEFADHPPAPPLRSIATVLCRRMSPVSRGLGVG